MKCGFAKVDITPRVGCRLAGYPQLRISRELADPLHIRALVFEEDSFALFLVFDVMAMDTATAGDVRSRVSDALGCRRDQIHVCATHTHTSPYTSHIGDPLGDAFVDLLAHHALEAAQKAIADEEEAQFTFAESTLEGISFMRRYRMRDGSVRTNPGRHNPEILEPVSPADESIRLLRIVRDKGDILLVGFQVHPDVRQDLCISADYPGVLCDTLEGALPGTHAIYFNGTAGDLNHIDVNCAPWDKNKGTEQMTHMGRTIAGKILSMCTKAQPIRTGAVRTAQEQVTLPRWQPTPEQLERASAYIRWHEEGEQGEPPYDGGMGVTHNLVEAIRVLAQARLTGELSLPVCAAVMGDLAVVTVPGEGFCRLGMELRRRSGCPATIALGLTNAYGGYFPTRDAFEVGGYEVRTSPFTPGVAEAILEAGLRLVEACKQ